MSNLDELIQEYCPNGVSYKKVGDIAVVGTGRSDKKDATPDGEYPFYVRSKIIARINTFEFDEEAIVIPGEGGIGEIFHYVTGKYALHQRAYRIHFTDSSVIPKFAYYHLMAHFKAFIMKKAVSATVTSIRKPMITDFPVPIPPLKVQKEIVNILDKFTQLEAELEAELEARLKQYEYYRNQLLTFSDEGGVRRTTLGEVGMFIRGNGLQKKDFTESGIGCIHYGQIFTHYGTFAEKTKTFVSAEVANKARKAKPGNLVIATTSENDEDVCKAVAWLGNEEIAVSSDAMIYDHNENPKYISYIFQTQDFFKQKKKYISGTKVRRVSSQNLAKINVALPPRREQDRIVGILDRFDSLVNSISEGLPAELSARRIQYEYYRTKLLTFQEVRA